MRHFTLELDELRNKLLEMGGIVESSVRRSVRALVQRDESLARKVLEDETRVNQMEMDIDRLSTTLLVRQQPVARDLRFITAVLKINTDLERVGDLAANNSERTLSLLHKPKIDIIIDIAHMSTLVESMLLKCLDAFVKEDADLAGEVLMSDDEVDNIRGAAYKDLVNYMQSNPEGVPTAIEWIFVVRNLERIADHATNIAEDVIFMAKGLDVRHHAKA